MSKDTIEDLHRKHCNCGSDPLCYDRLLITSAVKTERTAVVAYVREYAVRLFCNPTVEDIARSIEAGAHVEEDSP